MGLQERSTVSDGSRFIIYTNIPGAGTGMPTVLRRDDPDTYELSP